MSATTRQVQQHPKDMVSLQNLNKHSLNEKSLHALTNTYCPGLRSACVSPFHIPLYAVKALHIKFEQGVYY